MAANHIDVKKGQDFTLIDPSNKRFIICDGIGSYEDSGEVAKFISKQYITSNVDFFNEYDSYEKLPQQIIDKGYKGGTTYLTYSLSENKKSKISFLGNGSIFHLRGDFFPKEDREIFMYNNIMSPHINQKGALYRHVSSVSKNEHLEPTNIEITLNNPYGDILIFGTDGFTSKEDDGVIKDEERRFWQYQVNSLHFVLNSLHKFLFESHSSSDFQNDLNEWDLGVIQQLKENQMLEDDIALGVVISHNVLEHYKAISQNG